MPGIGLLLCDLDDTLVDRAGAFRCWAATFLERRRLPASDLEWMLETDRDGFCDRESYFTLVRERFRLGDPVAGLVDEFYGSFPHMLRCEPPVVAALERARAEGWRIAIVTNGSPSQEAKIMATGLDELVDGWCVSAMEGVRKPDPEIFRRAAARAGASLAGAWMVGDAPGADIGGAVAAGIESVWLTRGRRWQETGYEPTAHAHSLPAAIAAVVATRR